MASLSSDQQTLNFSSKLVESLCDQQHVRNGVADGESLQLGDSVSHHTH